MTVQKYFSIGVSGTRKGAVEPQRFTLEQTLRSYYVYGSRALHHGDCVGVDEQCASLGRLFGYHIVCHPPKDPRYRAHTVPDLFYPPKPYLERNRDVADYTSLLIACPHSMTDQRGGTWYTINYAKSKKKDILIITPEGKVVEYV